MGHVTFVHGIGNKPREEDLRRLWGRALADGDAPLPLGDLGVTTRMVYWADLLYPEPDNNIAAYEGLQEYSADAIDASGGIAAPTARNADEAKFLQALRDKMTTLSDAEFDLESPPEGSDIGLERVPLPWFIKKQFLAVFLRDVYYYLFDGEFAPAAGEPVHIQQTIRKRFVDALNGAEVSRPHVVVSHSLGTVIAYDCLKRVPGCPKIDALLTIGSPLGIDEIRDKLQPGWTENDGFPGETVSGQWANLYDLVDPVCGLVPGLAQNYLRNGSLVVEDTAVTNDGAWRHSATKYLRQPALREQLRQMLELGLAS